jgi:hypothetical protein
LTDAAQLEVNARSAFIGGSFVYTDFNISEAMFGTKSAQYEKVGLAHEVLVHYFSNLAAQMGQEGVTEISMLEYVPLFLRPNNVFGFKVNLALGMGPMNSAEADLRGMRNFTSHLDYKGQVGIRVWQENGLQGQPIPITKELWRKMGDYWRHTEAVSARNDYKGDPVPNPAKPRVRSTIFGDLNAPLGELN